MTLDDARRLLGVKGPSLDESPKSWSKGPGFEEAPKGRRLERRPMSAPLTPPPPPREEMAGSALLAAPTPIPRLSSAGLPMRVEHRKSPRLRSTRSAAADKKAHMSMYACPHARSMYGAHRIYAALHARRVAEVEAMPCGASGMMYLR